MLEVTSLFVIGWKKSRIFSNIRFSLIDIKLLNNFYLHFISHLSAVIAAIFSSARECCLFLEVLLNFLSARRDYVASPALYQPRRDCATRNSSHASLCPTDWTAAVVIQRRGLAGGEAVRGSVGEKRAEGRGGRRQPPRATAHPSTLRFGGGRAAAKATMRRTVRAGEGKSSSGYGFMGSRSRSPCAF